MAAIRHQFSPLVGRIRPSAAIRRQPSPLVGRIRPSAAIRHQRSTAEITDFCSSQSRKICKYRDSAF
ncbi:hypothetical protein HMPREF0208_00118, partial [Citrobacter koseri]